PALFVFAAGNNGGGDDDGTGGTPDSVLAPATAKNVISVGALEQPRNITNLVQPSYATTNQSAIFYAGSDSSNQVAGYSARGNVGIGTEGDFGRFKPDVVAPGSWVVSTRSADWDQIAYYNPTNYHSTYYLNQTVGTNGILVNYSVFVPNNAVQLQIQIVSTSGVPIYVSQSGPPTGGTPDGYDTYVTGFPPATADTVFYYSVGNTNSQPVNYSIFLTILTTNDNGNTFQVVSNLLNGPLAPYYRYESGSSMAAAAVSGTLALMQEFFEQRTTFGRPSPALMKALLVNGARSAAGIYDLQVQTPINYQGWGLVNLPTSLPGALTNSGSSSSPIQFFDQNPTNALATGQSQTRYVSLSAAARNQPLRVSLVWTDPPGDPSASIKLVNDLDLVVTNLDNGYVYFGNDISVNNNFTLPWDPDGPTNVDFVNNVENVFIAPLSRPLGASYSVTVTGHRVNVNAVTAHPDDTVQDYALVISSGDGTIADALTLSNTASGPSPVLTVPLVTTVTNTFGTNSGARTVGGVLLRQHVGANTPLLGTNTVARTGYANQLITAGMTNQWHFYVYENTSSFTNVAFATFLPPTLSVPRMGVRADSADYATRVEADIDLYVSTDPNLTNLAPSVLLAADKSLGRRGTEVVTFTNGGSQTYYIGVKAEDQMAAEYGFLGVASLLPFSENNNGVITVNGFPENELIPDGTPAAPGGVMIFGIATDSVNIRRAVVTNGITHELMGDLLGNLSHGDKFAVLNNHTGDNTPSSQTFVYEDNGEGLTNIPAAYHVKHTDGPGSLVDFIGEDGSGLWLLTMVDNAYGHTGQVDNLTIRLEPQTDTNGVVFTIRPGGTAYDYIDVPAAATNLTICVGNESATPLPVELFVRYGSLPTQTAYDYKKTINPPGDCLSISYADLPPLRPGRYFVGIYNPNAIDQTVRLTWTLDLNAEGAATSDFGAAGQTNLLDDAVNNSTIAITNTDTIASVEVGVVLEHPRVSDLSLTLLSPWGERFLLFEERGGPNATNLGHLNITTNFFGNTASGTFAANTNVIGPVPTSGILLIDYNFHQVPDTLDVWYDGVNIFSSGLISNPGPYPGLGTRQTFTIPYGPGTATNITIIMNQGNNPNPITVWDYTPAVVDEDLGYVTFTEDASRNPVPIKFAVPPFDGVKYTTNFTLSDFESAPAGNYHPLTNVPDAFGGWDVQTNQIGTLTNVPAATNIMVSVVTDATNAWDGSNFLALADGVITRQLPTIPGVKYSLTYRYRGPGIAGWWRGEGNPDDSAAIEDRGNAGAEVGNVTVPYPAGEVGQAFEFNGTNAYVQVPQSVSLDVGIGGGLSVECWISPTD
ncbi:MAG: S8 family serine peptidase, partial [Verrucomicrobia bacterium]|nr:S8 family serine peptidase [Verrucomicrobiota bacterium]